MEVMRPFRCWTLGMSKRYIVTLHQVITVYNDMFDQMDGVMQASTKKMTPWKGDSFLAMQLAWQKLSTYYAAVTPSTGMLHISAPILDLIRMLQTSWKLDKGIDINLWTRHRIQLNTKRPFWNTWWMNTVRNIKVCQSINTKAYRGTILSPPERFHDPVNHLSTHPICAVTRKNTWRQIMWLRLPQDEAIAQHSYCFPPRSIWIRRLKHPSTAGISIQISMITTPTQWRLEVHVGHRT